MCCFWLVSFEGVGFLYSVFVGFVFAFFDAASCQPSLLMLLAMAALKVRA